MNSRLGQVGILAAAAFLIGALVDVVVGQVTTNPRVTGLVQQDAIPVGTGTATATICGVLETNVTSTGTDANTNEKDLWSYTLPANTLSADGKGVRITAWGTYAANANDKTTILKFGSTNVAPHSTGAYNGSTWRLTADVLRTGVATQESSGISVWSNFNSGSSAHRTAPTETLTGAVAIKVTGQNGTASANDIVFRGAIVECLK